MEPRAVLNVSSRKIGNNSNFNPSSAIKGHNPLASMLRLPSISSSRPAHNQDTPLPSKQQNAAQKAVETKSEQWLHASEVGSRDYRSHVVPSGLEARSDHSLGHEGFPPAGRW